MPLYSYECTDCNAIIIDKFESIHAETVQICPVCEKYTLNRTLTAPAHISFSGGGWYKDSYATHDFIKNPSNTLA